MVAVEDLDAIARQEGAQAPSMASMTGSSRRAVAPTSAAEMAGSMRSSLS